MKKNAPKKGCGEKILGLHVPIQSEGEKNTSPEWSGVQLVSCWNFVVQGW